MTLQAFVTNNHHLMEILPPVDICATFSLHECSLSVSNTIFSEIHLALYGIIGTNKLETQVMNPVNISNFHSASKLYIQ